MEYNISITADKKEAVGTREENLPVYAIKVSVEAIISQGYLDLFLKDIDSIVKSYHVTASLV
jgi:hypothetical protein